MCKECGCDDKVKSKLPDSKPVKKIILNKSITEANDILADQNESFLKKKGIYCINLMGAPGSGKTTFIEGLCKFINPANVAVIQGDLESDIDKVRLEKKGIYTHQINTHSGCHLNAQMINKVLAHMEFLGKKYLIIENVGNLVCPAGVKIGQHTNMLISAVTEGSDKPKKYPIIFLNSDIIVISKYDLKDIVGFDEKRYLSDIKDINPKARIIKTSSKNPKSFDKLALSIVHSRDHVLGLDHHH